MIYKIKNVETKLSTGGKSYWSVTLEGQNKPLACWDARIATPGLQQIDAELVTNDKGYTNIVLPKAEKAPGQPSSKPKALDETPLILMDMLTVLRSIDSKLAAIAKEDIKF